MFFLHNYNDNDDDDDMGLEQHSTKELCMLLLPHLLVQMSGFGFILPTKRHPDGNRIWNEYRWHALFFFLRCVILMALAWSRKTTTMTMTTTTTQTLSKERYYPLANIAAVLFTMMGVDAVDAWFTSHTKQSPSATTTIRGLKGPPGLLHLMSAAQFHATLNSLLTTHHMSVQCSALAVVQLSAFGMTLCRKGIISHVHGLILYTLVVLLGMLVICHDLTERDLFYSAIAVGNMAAFVRMNLCVNKYIIWTVVCIAIPIIQENAVWWENVSRGEHCSSSFKCSCSTNKSKRGLYDNLAKVNLN
mmetsp:Transcript_7488/g.11247  ORF Transcript_7488/g.11247 Transcript_7488/m.11247 type:complete len:303 (-) Transcript_7488:495-1403(-)